MAKVEVHVIQVVKTISHIYEIPVEGGWYDDIPRARDEAKWRFEQDIAPVQTWPTKITTAHVMSHWKKVP